VLQQAYSWGVGSCCLYPSDLIQRQADNGWFWTGNGIFKTIVYQVCKSNISLNSLFPRDTAAYFAPEFLQGRFDIGSDLYTVGVAIIQLLTQLPLRELVHGSDGYFTIRRSWYRQRQLPEVLVEILSRMVHPNPMKRYSITPEVSSDLDKFIQRCYAKSDFEQSGSN
jgi:serine/threonine protein kinase